MKTNKQTAKILYMENSVIHQKCSDEQKGYLSQRKMFSGWSVHDIFTLIMYNNSPNVPNPYHKGDDVPCIQIHVNQIWDLKEK